MAKERLAQTNKQASKQTSKQTNVCHDLCFACSPALPETALKTRLAELMNGTAWSAGSVLEKGGYGRGGGAEWDCRLQSEIKGNMFQSTPSSTDGLAVMYNFGQGDLKNIGSAAGEMGKVSQKQNLF